MLTFQGLAFINGNSYEHLQQIITKWKECNEVQIDDIALLKDEWTDEDGVTKPVYRAIITYKRER